MAGAIEALYENLSVGRAIAAFFLFIVSSFIFDFVHKPKYPDVLPRMGHGKGLVASAKNYLSYFTSYRQWVQEGYDKVRGILHILATSNARAGFFGEHCTDSRFPTAFKARPPIRCTLGGESTARCSPPSIANDVDA